MAIQGSLPNDLLVDLAEYIEKGLLSFVSSVRGIDITIGNVENEDLSQIKTSLRQHLRGQELTVISLDRPFPPPIEERGQATMSREREGLGLLVSNPARRGITLFGVSCGSAETVIDLVRSATRIMSSNLYSEQFSGSVEFSTQRVTVQALEILNCKLDAEITTSLWSQLPKKRPSEIDISDSSISFLPSTPDLPRVYTLKVKGATLQSYEDLFSSLPGLKVIDITIDDAERDVSQITAGLRRAIQKTEDRKQKTEDGEQKTEDREQKTGDREQKKEDREQKTEDREQKTEDREQKTEDREQKKEDKEQKPTEIHLRSPDSLPKDKETTLSSDTLGGLGRLIKKQTKNLKKLTLAGQKCTNEEDLVNLIECCRHVKAMENIDLWSCGTKEGGKVESHLKNLHSCLHQITVITRHDDADLSTEFKISHIIE